MSITIEEKKGIIQNILRGDLWPSDCERAQNKDGTIDCFENYRAVNEAFDAELKGKNDLSFNEYFQSFYSLIINLRNSGALIKKTTQVVAPPTVDPKTTIPHRDLFPNVKSIEQAIRYVKTAKIPGNQLNAINELLAYLQLHDLHEYDVIAEDPEVGEAPEDGEIAEARSLVNGLKISDIGTTTSAAGGGRWSQLIALQNRLNKTIDSAKQRRATGVLKYVQDEIAKQGDRGIK
jgi:hypothetical protein